MDGMIGFVFGFVMGGMFGLLALAIALMSKDEGDD